MKSAKKFVPFIINYEKVKSLPLQITKHIPEEMCNSCLLQDEADPTKALDEPC